MDKEEVDKVSPGLYMITWDDGSQSSAAIGMTETGGKWIAATNWVGLTTDGRKLNNIWSCVMKLDKISLTNQK